MTTSRYCDRGNKEMKTDNWISLKDKRPVMGVRVLIWVKDRRTTVLATMWNDGYRKRTYHFTTYDLAGASTIELEDVTHWQPLPLKPSHQQ